MTLVVVKGSHPILDVPENTVVYTATNYTVIVDPGPIDAKALASHCIGETYILLTHCHWDHLLTANDVAEQCDAEVYAPRGAIEYLLDIDNVVSWIKTVLSVAGASTSLFESFRDMFLNLYGKAQRVAERAEPVEKLDASRIGVRVLECSGHTWHHVCYIVSDVLVAGDTVTEPSTPVVLDLEKYLSTLSRILKARWSSLVPGHGQLMQRPKAVETIESIRRRKLRRLVLLLNTIVMLSELSSRDAIEKVYGPTESSFELFTRSYNMVGYISFLEKTGVIEVDKTVTPWRIRLIDRDAAMNLRASLSRLL